MPLEGARRIWPVDQFAREMAAAEEAEVARLQASRAQRAAEEARWTSWDVTPPDSASSGPVVVETRSGPVHVRRRATGLMMSPEGAEAARAAGCVVEPVRRSRAPASAEAAFI